MGLDNGLMIQGKTAAGRRMLKDNFNHLKDEYSDGTVEYEFIYWRKCWNMRNRMEEFGLLDDADNKTLTIENLVTVVEDVLKYFLNEDNWVHGNSFSNGSIWNWTTMIATIAQEIHDIREFIEDVEANELTDEDFKIYFYDSY